VDFKGEAITFKATTAGIVATMSHCIDLMSQREDQWRRKLEREQTARKRLEEKCKNVADKRVEDKAKQPGGLEGQPVSSNPVPVKAAPTAAPSAASAASKVVSSVVSREYEESVALSQIGEDEFFDAVENALDKLQEEQDYRDKMKLMSLSAQQDVQQQMSEATQHQLWPTIDKGDALRHARHQTQNIGTLKNPSATLSSAWRTCAPCPRFKDLSHHHLHGNKFHI